MKANVTPDEWSAMSDSQQRRYMNEQEKVYVAANGHQLQPYAQWVNGRPLYSSAFTGCTDECGACKDGEPLLDW